MKFLKFQRSAIAPVGIVAVVSMNTISNRNRAKIAVSKTLFPRKKPVPPAMPNGLPNIGIVSSLFKSKMPWPSDGCDPIAPGATPNPPNMIAKPQIQKPSMPSP
jgi:hypothetical protein